MTTDPGICASCCHARVVRGANSTFWLCELSRTDPRFPRYPRLPVLRCAGHVRADRPDPAPGASSSPRNEPPDLVPHQ